VPDRPLVKIRQGRMPFMALQILGGRIPLAFPALALYLRSLLHDRVRPISADAER
jgi:hypothetical protein